MGLTSGGSIASYEIVGLIGADGMGEAWSMCVSMI